MLVGRWRFSRSFPPRRYIIPLQRGKGREKEKRRGWEERRRRKKEEELRVEIAGNFRVYINYICPLCTYIQKAASAGDTRS